MATLVNDLLLYSRIASQARPLVQTNGATVLTNVIANLALAISESGATITFDKLPMLNADPTQLAQVFQNLIANAIKFRGERAPEIHVGASEQDGICTMFVRDNGIGIEPQYYGRVFEVFQRLHTRTEYQGTGIGLAICKKIVERHGGRIWIESTPGTGSAFYFTLSSRN
jgi:light-regulated signal transduction histidine kinase (bacteriophytochrome)